MKIAAEPSLIQVNARLTDPFIVRTKGDSHAAYGRPYPYRDLYRFRRFCPSSCLGRLQNKESQNPGDVPKSGGLIGKFVMSCLRLCLLWSLIAAALPAVAGDADNGERLAQRWCVACHVVTTVQTSTTTDQAPPFPSIAKKPDFDAAKIALFLLDPHPKMPDMGLSRKEAADLAAYIATLK
jgi:mono/diheme cytochrome c family protein